MKACNFAAFDSKLKARGINALSNASKADRDLWSEFERNPDAVAQECEAVYENLLRLNQDDRRIDSDEVTVPDGPTEIDRCVEVRRVQRFFRSAVLSSYDFSCAISGLDVRSLLIASHIIPWATSPDRRADPRNGIALNAIYDLAFDKGLLTIDENLHVVLSPQLYLAGACDFHRATFLAVEGHSIRLPSRFTPDPEALRYHRENIFLPD
jgi:putative restriction endonuclease